MEMKRILIAAVSVLLGLSLYCQSDVIGWEYAYDNAGNRISRTVIYMSINRLASDSTGNSFEYYAELSPEDENPDSLSLRMSGGGISVSVFPNPVKEYINIEVYDADDNSAVSYQLIDLNGRVVSEGIINGALNTVNLSGMANGGYVLRLLANGRRIEECVVVKD